MRLFFAFLFACFAPSLLSLVLLLGIAGCAGKSAEGPAVKGIDPWRWENVEGHVIRTPHYRIYTTVDDPAVMDRFARLMEAAFAEYARMAPPLPGPGGETTPMQVYLFDDPGALQAFTIKLTGKDAAVYLSVGTGGYTYGNKVVCFLGSESDTHGTAAHEGFHQYIAHHFKTRLPPALDEGLACTFETVEVGAQSVRFDRRNARRAAWLARAVKDQTLIPFDTLILLHGGDLAGRPLPLMEAYYGQCWALARLLRDDPKYAAGFQRMLRDIQTGHLQHDVGPTDAPQGEYRPRAIRPLLRTYVAPDWAELVADYEKTCITIARAEGGSTTENSE